MTSEEKLNCLTDRPCIVCKYHKENGCSKWACVFEQEPTTKNDLGVERQIKEICISYPKSNLKEHDGKPYYSIMYVENGKEHQGYGTYKIEVFMEYLKNYFMPSITPQESKSEWQKDHELLKAYSDGANEMLDKIRAEIEQEIIPRNSDQYDHEAMWQNMGLRMALKVIDKYKGESEEV